MLSAIQDSLQSFSLTCQVLNVS